MDIILGIVVVGFMIYSFLSYVYRYHDEPEDPHEDEIFDP